jgi:DNA-binding cell septation regulator SpoVG
MRTRIGEIMQTLKISEIQITPVRPQNGLVAFASFVINNHFFIGQLALYTCPRNPDGYRLVYPIKTLNNGTTLSITHPINRDTGDAVQKEVAEAYRKLIENLTKEGKDEQCSEIT